MRVDTFCVPTGSTPDSLPTALDDGSRVLVLMFGPSNLLDSPGDLRPILEAYPQATVLGCSTAGEIVGSEIRDNSVTGAIVSFESTTLKLATAQITKMEDSYAAGSTIAQALREPALRGVFVLSDGLQVNGSELVRGINAVLPQSVVVTGGLAGDGDRFKRTWVLKDRTPVSGYVTALGLYGAKVRVGHGSNGGWDIFGPERIVTRSQNNVLYELDGKPALQLYKEYLGERATGLPATGLLFPLSLRAHHDDPNRLVRTILAVDESNQSMTFAGNIPQGHLAQLMQANFDRLIDGASQAAQSSKLRGGDNSLAVAISCVGRRLILGERAEEETEATQDLLPKGTKQIGFYSYGEISPLASGNCDLLNQTMTLTTISEA